MLGANTNESYSILMYLSYITGRFPGDPLSEQDYANLINIVMTTDFHKGWVLVFAGVC
jgi:hypothetical protein